MTDDEIHRLRWPLFVFTRHRWGWDFRIPFGWLCYINDDEWGHRLYFSTDATPFPATTLWWFRR